jgi:hypothetical protein
MMGWFGSKILAKFWNDKNGNYLSFDSFSINFLGGKIMFRNLRYACSDYSGKYFLILSVTSFII